MTDPTIHLSFRFHGNFYHSYRGDTPDELGFGKDMRIIRHVIRTLDSLNQQGIPICGTWDFENYFSLETIMPEYCPDIIESLQHRVGQGHDEMQLMSYNNGLVSAHTAREFEEAICRGISNPQGSGLRDLFGAGFYPMVRPQEMMFTPIHLKLYPACGIQSISLYYSAIPFNGFSNFIPPLGFAERYNPLTLTYAGIAESMTLMPCYNHGDLIDHLTLRRWIKQLRRQQLALPTPQDMLLLIDLDADDTLWVGFDIPLVKKVISTARGLQGMVENILDLDYVHFTTPGRYLAEHAPLRTVSFGQDTADGSFDGLSSWAEKWSNQHLWTGLERGRMLELQTRRLQDQPDPNVERLLTDCMDTRLKILSTTHFGMSAPVMNVTREGIAYGHVSHLVKNASQAFELVRSKTQAGQFSLVDYPRGIPTAEIQYPAKPSRCLVRLPMGEDAPETPGIQDVSGHAIPSALLETNVFFVDGFEAGQRKDYRILPQKEPAAPENPVLVSEQGMHNEHLAVTFDQNNQLVSVLFGGVEFAGADFLSSAISYKGRTHHIKAWQQTYSESLGVVGVKRMQGQVEISQGKLLWVEREFILATSLPYLYLNVRVTYPKTPDEGYNKEKAQRLQCTYDPRWQEVMPCELRPALAGQNESPLRVWKHNYCDHVSSYTLDYETFSENDTLDSINNHVTHAWLAVSDGNKGLLLAQNADVNSGMAFCPLRTRREGTVKRIHLNPFGSYSGRQYRYATQDTGLGKVIATAASASDHLQPYAPSYNGHEQVFSLLLAPYTGDEPPAALQNDAEAFAYPYALLNDGSVIKDPPHRSWDGAGLREIKEGQEAGIDLDSAIYKLNK
jgi:hypothetical protein